MTEGNAQELRRRVVFALLLPAARLALGGGVPLKEVKQLAELALYRQARRTGLKLREIRDVLDVSMSKVGLLSKELKDHFAAPELQHGLGRRILSLLWAGPLTQARLHQALSEYDAGDVDRALEGLLADRRVVARKARTVDVFELGAPAHRLVQEPWLARLDALEDLAATVTDAITARFFEGDGRALARTVSFRARPADLDRLRKAYEEVLFPLIEEIDAAAVQGADSAPMRLSLVWAPNAELEGGPAPEPDPQEEPT